MGNSSTRSSVPCALALLACASCGSSPVSVATNPLGAAHWDVLQSLAQTGLDSQTSIDGSVLEMLPSSDVKVSFQVRTPQRVRCTSCDQFFASGCRAGLGTTAGTSACSKLSCAGQCQSGLFAPRGDYCEDPRPQEGVSACAPKLARPCWADNPAWQLGREVSAGHEEDRGRRSSSQGRRERSGGGG